METISIQDKYKFFYLKGGYNLNSQLKLYKCRQYDYNNLK